jgi:hypothetical protein
MSKYITFASVVKNLDKLFFKEKFQTYMKVEEAVQ